MVLERIGTLIALIGMILLLFPVGGLLLSRCGFFKELAGAPAPAKSARGITWWTSALIFVALPAAAFFSFTNYFNTWKMKANALFPENITTQLIIWVLLVGAISLVLFLLWHFVFNRRAQASASDYGVSWGTGFTGVGWMKIVKSFLLALTVAFIAYLTVALSAWFFTTDYRIWVSPSTFSSL